MKKIPWPVALLLVVIATVVVYKSYVSSFVREPSTHAGPPAMPPQATKAMEAKAKREQAENAKEKKPNAKNSLSTEKSSLTKETP